MKQLLLFFGSLFFLFVQSCQTPGCTDPTACNYDPNATVNNSSCDYSCYNNCTGGPITVSGHLTSNETWSPPCIYYLDGNVVVDPGVTLTIEPGTIIKGKQGTGANTAILIVEVGATINANGTAAAPIVFTSELDNIASGQIVGSNLNQTDIGLWGGVVIAGEAPVSTYTGNTTGVLDYAAQYNYGGNYPNDNSGTLSYVSIRHTGSFFNAGNELSGLVLAGVGQGTQINNIEIVACSDDGLNLLGGTANLTNLIVGFVGDDGIDLDQNYAGTIDNFIVKVDSSYADEFIEADGPEGTTYTNGLFTLRNGSCYCPTNSIHGPSIEVKAAAQGTFNNIIANALGTGIIKVRASFLNCSTDVLDAWTNITASTPSLVFTNIQYSNTWVYTATTDALSNPCPIPPSHESAVQAAILSTGATGASSTGWGWTWMSAFGFI